MRAAIVQVVPDSWGWVDGRLIPSNLLTNNPHVELGTGYTLSRFGIRLLFLEDYAVGRSARKELNLYALLVEQKYPGFIIFDCTGYEGQPISLRATKELIGGFLRRGYSGSLTFYRDCYRNEQYSNSARCEMRFGSWEAQPLRASDPEGGEQPPRIKLEWKERYNGKPEIIASFITLFRALGLKEYVPTRNICSSE